MPNPKTAEDDSKQLKADEYREIVANAYAFVEAQKSVQTFAALTPEDLMDRFIERVSGKDTQARPNVLNRYKKIKQDILSSIEKIKAMPPEAFRKASKKEDVNTPTTYDVEVEEGDLYSTAAQSQEA